MAPSATQRKADIPWLVIAELQGVPRDFSQARCLIEPDSKSGPRSDWPAQQPLEHFLRNCRTAVANLQFNSILAIERDPHADASIKAALAQGVLQPVIGPTVVPFLGQNKRLVHGRADKLNATIVIGALQAIPP